MMVPSASSLNSVQKPAEAEIAHQEMTLMAFDAQYSIDRSLHTILVKVSSRIEFEAMSNQKN